MIMIMMMMYLRVTALHAPSSVRVEHTSAPAAPVDGPTVSAQQFTTITTSRVQQEMISSSQQQQQHAAPPHIQGTSCRLSCSSGSGSGSVTVTVTVTKVFILRFLLKDRKCITESFTYILRSPG